jgi:hypothetical protein
MQRRDVPAIAGVMCSCPAQNIHGVIGASGKITVVTDMECVGRHISALMLMFGVVLQIVPPIEPMPDGARITSDRCAGPEVHRQLSSLAPAIS